MPPTQEEIVETIISIVVSHPISATANIAALEAEYRQVIDVAILTPPQRKHILQILHSTRALDSTLRAILDHYSIRGDADALGKYLYKFRDHRNRHISNICDATRMHYQTTIVQIRNLHLHNAGSYPNNDLDVYALIGEMNALLALIATL